MADLLKTDYKDDVLNAEVNTQRKYQMITNDDGTVSFIDVTDYSQVGDSFGSLDINSTNEAINGLKNEVIPATRGGTGKTTLNESANVLMNALSTGSTTPVDEDYYISQSAGGGNVTTTYHRRPVSALWNYIKGKLSGGTLSDNLTIKKSSGLADFILESGARKGALEVSSGTQAFGLWDFTNSEWVLVSNKDRTVSIPHGVSVASLTVNGKSPLLDGNPIIKIGNCTNLTLTAYAQNQLNFTLKITNIPSGYTPVSIEEVRFDYPTNLRTIYARCDSDGTIKLIIKNVSDVRVDSPFGLKVKFVKTSCLEFVNLTVKTESVS